MERLAGRERQHPQAVRARPGEEHRGRRLLGAAHREPGRRPVLRFGAGSGRHHPPRLLQLRPSGHTHRGPGFHHALAHPVHGHAGNDSGEQPQRRPQPCHLTHRHQLDTGGPVIVGLGRRGRTGTPRPEHRERLYRHGAQHALALLHPRRRVGRRSLCLGRCHGLCRLEGRESVHLESPEPLPQRRGADTLHPVRVETPGLCRREDRLLRG